MNFNSLARTLPVITGILVAGLSGCGQNSDQPDVVVGPSTNAVIQEKVVEAPAKPPKGVVKKQVPTREPQVVPTPTRSAVVNSPPKLPAPAPPPPGKAASKVAPPPPGPRIAAAPAGASKPPAAFAPLPTQAVKSEAGIGAQAETGASLVVRGKITEITPTPDINNAPYPEALLFIKYRVVSVVKGQYKPRELLVAHWGMRKKALTGASRYRVGEEHQLALVPLSERAELERVMTWNDIEDFELTPYFALRVN